MKDIFVIHDSLENKISYFHLAAFVILLPFNRFYSELVLLSLLLHALIHINISRLRSVLTFQNLILSSVFLVNLAGLIYSPDKSEASKNLERQLAILLFPILFSLTGLDWQQYKMRILKIFGFTCLLTILYLYADAIHIIVYNKLPIRTLFSQAFINQNFSEHIGLHATYFAMYISLSTAVFLYLFLEEKKINYRLLYAMAIGILLAGLLQLASRSVLIATVIMILVAFPLLMPSGILRLRFILVSVLVLLISILGITKIDSLKKRYIADFRNDLTQASINNEILEPRIIRWRYTVNQTFAGYWLRKRFREKAIERKIF